MRVLLADWRWRAEVHPLALEDAHRGPRAQELPGEVDTNHGVPILKAHIDQIGVFLQAGVGHQNIQVAEGIEGLCEQALDISLLGHIATDGKRPTAVGIDLCGKGLGGGRLGVVVKHYCRARVGQGFGCASTDA